MMLCSKAMLLRPSANLGCSIPCSKHENAIFLREILRQVTTTPMQNKKMS